VRGNRHTHWPSTGHSNSHHNTTPLPYDGRRLAYTLRIHYNAIVPAYSVMGAYGTGIYWYIPDPARIPAPYSDPANTTASGTNTDAAFHITTQASGIQKPTPGVRNRPTGSVLRPYYGPITYFLYIPASGIRIRHLYPPFPGLQ